MLKNNITLNALICIIILTLISCQNETVEFDNDSTLKEIGKNNIVKTGKLKDFDMLNEYVLENIINVKDLESLDRLNIENDNSFTIIDNSITEINDENGRTFTLKIIKDQQPENSFSNLIINFKESDDNIAYIVNYMPNSDYLTEVVINPDAIFKGQYNMENIIYDGELDVLNSSKLFCFDVTNTYCNWGGTEHQAGPNCTASYIYNSTQTVCIDVKEFENPDVDNVDESGTTNDSTSGGGGGGGGATSSNPNYVNNCDVVSAFGESDVSDGCDESNENNTDDTNVTSIGYMRLTNELNDALSDYESFEYDGNVNPDASLIFNSVDEFIEFWYYPDEQEGEEDDNIVNFQNDTHTSVQHYSLDALMNTRLKVEVQIQPNSDAEPIEILNVNSSLVGITSFRDWTPNENYDIQINQEESELTLVYRGDMKVGIVINSYGLYVTATYIITIKYDLNSGLLLSSNLLIIR